MMTKARNKDVVLYSGGLDSFITLKFVENLLQGVGNLAPVYVKLNHRYQAEELAAIEKTRPDTQILTGMEGLGTLEENDAFIWHRNAFLCLRASKMIDPDEGTIWLTVQKDELSIPDRTEKFMQQMGVLLESLGQKIVVTSPWIDYDKTDMVRWYVRQGHSIEELKSTHSCYSPGIVPCGNCPACVRRFIAMSLNQIEEEYEIDPKESEEAARYLQRAKDGYYSKDRNQRTIEALK